MNTEQLLREAHAAFLQGKFAEAEASCRQLLLRMPNAVQGHRAMSSILFRLGRADEARKHGLYAIQLQPDDPGAYADLIQNLGAARADDEAHAVVDNALASHGTSSTFLRRLAELLSQSGRFIDAARLADQYIELSPDAFEGWFLLARICAAQRETAGAIAAATRALAVNSSSAEVHLLLGTSFADIGDYANAAEHYERAVVLKPGDPLAYSALGEVRQRQGDFAGALPLLERSVELCPTNGYAQYTLMRAARAKPGDEAKLAKIEKLAADPGVSKYDRMGLHNALGIGWEELGDYERSIAAYDGANTAAYEIWLGGKSWDRAKDQEFFSKLIEQFTSGSIRSLQRDAAESNRPVFIAGMPRSGTSLVEQIVSSHSQVAGAGELDFWLVNAGDVLSGPARAIVEKQLHEAADKYLGVLGKAGPGAARVTDKMPQNYAILGMVCAAYPNARIIHVRRDPIDTCLSIYTTPFGHGMPFSHRREDIVFAYREYLRIMEHWRSSLDPLQFIEVDYESVVANRETVSRQMIEFLGLSWDGACLHHEQNKRLVHTASLWQVRQPIYTSSVERWRNFAQWIPEFIELRDGLGYLL